MYLMRKEENEYDGDEVSVWEAYRNVDDSFMPDGKTLYMNVKKIFNFSGRRGCRGGRHEREIGRNETGHHQPPFKKD